MLKHVMEIRQENNFKLEKNVLGFRGVKKLNLVPETRTVTYVGFFRVEDEIQKSFANADLTGPDTILISKCPD